jgi:Transglycosylase SLT domain
VLLSVRLNFRPLAFDLIAPKVQAVIHEQMRKSVLLAILFTLLFTISAAAQNTYKFDNFSFENGVRVQLPAPPVTRSSDKVGRKLTSSRNFKYSPPAGALVHLTSQNINSSMGEFTTGNLDVDNFIVDSGKRNSVDPLLLYSIMHQESSFKPRAMSYKGARGLMQLMPPTAGRFGVTNIWDPKQNIEGGARYMRFLLDLFAGDVNLALAGYNAGEGAVIKYGYSIPPYSETQEYVRRIGRRYSLIRDPLAAARASNFTSAQVAEVQQRDPKPLNVYERSVFMARLPDGRLQLVSQ